MVASDSAPCVGVGSEYKGTHKQTGQAFWRVDCANKQSYLIGIENDRAGSTKVLSCDFMRALTKKDECFIKWK